MNRLKEFLSGPPEPERHDDYFEIHCRYDTFVVSRAVALEIEHRLDEMPASRWIVFCNLADARHRIRPTHVSRVSESTATQRANVRACPAPRGQAGWPSMGGRRLSTNPDRQLSTLRHRSHPRWRNHPSTTTSTSTMRSDGES